MTTTFDYVPAATAIAFYVTVFAIAEIGRKAVEVLFAKGNPIRVFLIEFIGTTQMCTCVYENGIMIQHYGIIGFFLTVSTLLIAGGIWNRGAFVSPLPAIEMLYYGKITLGQYLPYSLGEVLGGMVAFRAAAQVWWWTYDISAVHQAYANNIMYCNINYKVSFAVVVLFELLGCALIRIFVAKAPAKIKNFAIPVFVAGMLSFALAFIGMPGLNPVVASSRMFGCPGLDQQWFMAVYWICPVIGWLVGAEVANRLTASSTKKAQKAAKESKKAAAKPAPQKPKKNKKED